MSFLHSGIILLLVVLVMAYVVLVHHGWSSGLLGPITHDRLHSSPFYFIGPCTAATGKSTETGGCPGYNDKFKDQFRGQRFEEAQH
jgi:hypothetical protein